LVLMDMMMDMRQALWRRPPMSDGSRVGGRF
jgi:hypothetical protein